jgi:hypothetical protein
MPTPSARQSHARSRAPYLASTVFERAPASYGHASKSGKKRLPSSTSTDFEIFAKPLKILRAIKGIGSIEPYCIKTIASLTVHYNPQARMPWAADSGKDVLSHAQWFGSFRGDEFEYHSLLGEEMINKLLGLGIRPEALHLGITCGYSDRAFGIGFSTVLEQVSCNMDGASVSVTV